MILNLKVTKRLKKEALDGGNGNGMSTEPADG